MGTVAFAVFRQRLSGGLGAVTEGERAPGAAGLCWGRSSPGSPAGAQISRRL